MISKTSIIYENVELGTNVIIEDNCIIGAPVYNREVRKTVIGDNAIIRAGTVIYAGNIIGSGFQTGNKANIRENNKIGDNVSVGTLTVIEHDVLIKNNVRIHSQAFIPEYCELHENAWIGPNVVLTNAKYPAHPDAKQNLSGVIVSENARIGANSTILPGITIGRSSLVGAGSVVCKNVEAGTVVAGNPAKYIKDNNY